MGFAQTTEVPVERSQSEIQKMLVRAGATAFLTGWETGRAFVSFEMRGRRIRFFLPLPDKSDERYTHTSHFHRYNRKRLSADSALKKWEQACRSRWRGLLLCIKAKLESVDSGIECFDDAFMAHIDIGNGTVGAHVRKAITAYYEQRPMPPLLPHYVDPDEESSE